MGPKWLRLLACVNVATFLVANTHVGASIAGHLSPRTGTSTSQTDCRSACGSPGDDPHKHGASSCCHRPEDESQTSEASEVAQDQSRAPCCPDCPDRPFSPKCPCPGGCPSCNVAKVPCLLSASCVTVSSCCLGDSVTEPPTCYTPPFSGRMRRPPRI